MENEITKRPKRITPSITEGLSQEEVLLQKKAGLVNYIRKCIYTF